MRDDFASLFRIFVAPSGGVRIEVATKTGKAARHDVARQVLAQLALDEARWRCLTTVPTPGLPAQGRAVAGGATRTRARAGGVENVSMLAFPRCRRRSSRS